jgi:ketosteroid isomerase-like protein
VTPWLFEQETHRALENHCIEHLTGGSMETPSPLDVVTRLVHAMNKGDLEIAVSLFEAGAAFVVKPGVVVTGTVAIRQALAGFMAVKPAITIEAHQIVEAGDVAQYCARWKIQGTDPAGNVVQMSGRSSSILRRQSNGTWLFLLDNPWGTGIIA